MQEFSVAVVIPTYNRLESLRRALDSVLAQTYLPNEIIVVDDGSIDDTAKALAEDYPQVRYIFQGNQGVSKARNVGIQSAASEWVALLDSDDEWVPEKLSKQVHALQSRPELKVCHTQEIWIRNGLRVNQMDKHEKFGGWIYQHCLPLCAMSPSSIMIHSSIFNEVGLFNEDLPACEDYDLWLRICARFPVLYLEQALIRKYGGHEDQLSRRYWGMDRFRIRSLVNMLEDKTLDNEAREATRDMLRKKIVVYLKGAKKRNKMEEISHYQSLLEQYT